MDNQIPHTLLLAGAYRVTDTPGQIKVYDGSYYPITFACQFTVERLAENVLGDHAWVPITGYTELLNFIAELVKCERPTKLERQ